ncbi:uncharacterized protein LOC8281160 [Ricinus communis]|uniref:DUF1677 domain-containing protein n=1 Tax=Ricinus communis TaxID=3988 RepID=B9RR91_RICCO|nr:uncharacterized protein LOC8281160 [Ricinus communis]XP_015572907.1 uncharacterized protein LOC8281160 [Ricinus communis]XP_015572908.1 uncharacterized protein LOC8281160 [Ricinus communis]EEF46262.1 conserved hypothetical protein [Ricinus communis]|eukprot:XP_002516260.1 uncharacterized protein LOC8281160 [Ricinus communis]
MAISTSDTQSTPATKPLSQLEVESVRCYSCGFTEECTPAYISRVRERYHGRWICGLCVEAVKDEIIRSDMDISTEEALNRHISFCNKFRSSSCSLNETEHPISVMGRLLLRSLDSPRGAPRSNSTSVLPDVDKINNGSSLVRSGSCFSALSR